MKPLLNTTFLFLLLTVGFAGGVSGQDFEETKRLADQGFSEAQNNLGFMYYHGEGVPQSYAEAVKWYRLAAEQGHASAQSEMGNMYADGEGIPENDAEAVRWFRLAAEQGYAPAQHNLGNMYAGGESVPQNNLRAYVWWSVAAVQGREDSRNNRDIVAGKLTPEQLAQGQDMAARCFESDYQDCE